MAMPQQNDSAAAKSRVRSVRARRAIRTATALMGINTAKRRNQASFQSGFSR
ncbi:hypothetical protein PMNALOAF_0978 [Methylobacterium adhaesivum]|nr:hypothetical protein PMNALOAF_0978 [Methylobacterium adhaesivum]